MAGSSIATAYITIVPDMRGAAKEIRNGIVTAAGTAGEEGSSKATKAFKNGFSTVKVAVGNILANGFSQLTGAISSTMSSAIERVDILNNFPRVMQNLGYETDDATKSVQRLNEYVSNGIPTTLQDITALTQKIAPLVGNLDGATTIAQAFNDALVASGATTSDQQRAMTQYTQMLSKGKVDIQAWNTMQEVMGAQLNQVGKKLLGAKGNSQKLYDAMKSGKVSFDDFNNALIALDKKGLKGYSSFAQQAKDASGGIETSITNLKSAFTKGFADILDAIGQEKIAQGLNSVKKAVKKAFKEIQPTVIETVDGMVYAWEQIAPVLSTVWSLFEQILPVIKPVVKKMFELTTEVLSNKAAWGVLFGYLAVNKFTKIFGGASLASKGLGGLKKVFSGFGKAKNTGKAIEKVGDAATSAGTKAKKGSKGLGKFSKSFKGLSKMSGSMFAIGGALVVVAGAFWIMSDAAAKIGDSGGVALAAFSTMLVGIAGIVAVFTKFIPKLKGCESTMVLFGASLAIIAAGMYVMAQAATAMSADGGLAFASFALMIAGISGLAVVFAAIMPRLEKYQSTMIVFAAAVAILAVSMSMMAQASIALSDAGGLAIGIMAGFIVVIAALVFIFAAVGPLLTANVAGILAVGVAISAILLSLTALIYAVTALTYAITNAVTVIAPLIIAVITAVGITICAIVTTVGNTIQGIIESIGKVIVDIVTSIGDSVSKVVDSISGGITDIIQTSCDGISKIVETIGDAVSKVVDSLSNFVTAVANLGYALPYFAEYGGSAAGGILKFGAALASLSFGDDEVSAMQKLSGSIRTIAGTGKMAAQGLLNCQTVAKSVPVTFSKAANVVVKACKKIQSSINHMKLKIPKVEVGELPKLTFKAGKTKDNNKVTLTSKVDWYAKGGIFDSASLVGVGEAGSEAVLPLNKRSYAMMGEGIVDNLGSDNRADEILSLLEDIKQILPAALTLDGKKVSSNVNNRLGRRASLAYAKGV